MCYISPSPSARVKGRPWNRQNHRCKGCGRQFVLQADNRLVDEDQRTLVERLLLEKISLHGICRVVGVSLRWVMNFMVTCFDAVPGHLHI
jgi:insertion element IS1 protein InsB